jgi:hypothetical protein
MVVLKVGRMLAVPHLGHMMVVVPHLGRVMDNQRAQRQPVFQSIERIWSERLASRHGPHLAIGPV